MEPVIIGSLNTLSTCILIFSVKTYSGYNSNTLARVLNLIRKVFTSELPCTKIFFFVQGNSDVNYLYINTSI